MLRTLLAFIRNTQVWTLERNLDKAGGPTHWLGLNELIFIPLYLDPDATPFLLQMAKPIKGPHSALIRCSMDGVPALDYVLTVAPYKRFRRKPAPRVLSQRLIHY